MPQFFAGLPTGTQVLNTLSVSESDLSATPTQALNVPYVSAQDILPVGEAPFLDERLTNSVRAYGNWTDGGWSVRLHGNIFKQPNISREKLDDLANVFLIDTKIEDLPEDQQDQARNLTSEIFVVQQSQVNVTITFVNDVEVKPGNDGGAINAVSRSPAM